MHAASAGGGGRSSGTVMPRAGDVIAGKYAIVRVIGEGGMGIVYEATHQRLRQRVAIKMLLPVMLEHQVIVSRFEREARAVAQLRGRHIARVTDVDVTADGLPYMVMDFLEGHDLQVELERRGRLPVAEAVDYVLQACAAMVEAHKVGIVHRDLKPSNLFLEKNSKRGSASGDDDDPAARIVKVLDFGISKTFTSPDDGDAKLTEVDAMVGTAMYMSPEQIRASHAVDARSDIWTLGVILYEALAGRVPWLGGGSQVAAAIVTEDAPDLRTLCTSTTSSTPIPNELSAIVHKTLQRNPNHRFADVKGLASALAPFAPPGSAGRTFAENLGTTGSYPRLASMTPNAHLKSGADDSSKTILNAPGVSEDAMHSHGGNTDAGGAAPSRGRAALIGVLVAFVFGLIVIGGVAFFVRPRAPTVIATPAVEAPVPTPTPAPTPTPTPTPSATVEPTTTPPPPTAKPVAVKPPTAKPTASTPAAAAPSTKTTPAAPKPSSAPPLDKPLFL